MRVSRFLYVFLISLSSLSLVSLSLAQSGVRPRVIVDNPQRPSQPAPEDSSGGSINPPTDTTVTSVTSNDDVLRVETNLVTVPVTVMDRSGNYVPNLQKQDFQLYENDVEQHVAYFYSVDKPFSVALILDVSASTQYKITEIQDAALAFVNQLRPDDRVMIVAFDDKIRVLTNFTNDRKKMEEAILSTRTGGNTRLYDAVDLVMNKYMNRIEGRKAIVLFTDGVDTNSKKADYDSTLRDAEELDALIYPVQYDTYNDLNSGTSTGSVAGTFPWPRSIPGLPTPNSRGPVHGGSRGEYAKADAYLTGLATVTGARAYKVNHFTDLDRTFQLVAEELRRQYSLGYYPQSSASIAERRRIRVRVKQGGLVVRSRTSYTYKSEQAMNRSPGSGQKPENQPEDQPKNQKVKTKQLKTDAQGNVIIP